MLRCRNAVLVADRSSARRCSTETQCDDRVRWLVYHPRWIATGAGNDFSGGNRILDLALGPTGTAGQLIEMVSESEAVVRAESLSAYFDAIATKLERGELVPAMNPWGYEVLQ